MVASQPGQPNFTPDSWIHAATSVPDTVLNPRQMLKNKLFMGKVSHFLDAYQRSCGLVLKGLKTFRHKSQEDSL